MTLTRIRELLSAATPGPWSVIGTAQVITAADATLIAAAPTLLALLADAVEAAQAVVDDWMSDEGVPERVLDNLAKALQALESWDKPA